MRDTPLYRLNRQPRFSVNHLTKYLSTANAKQRENIIRDAKFPKKIPVSLYQQSKKAIQEFFSHGNGDISFFDEPLSRLATKARRDEFARDEAIRCIKAIEAFKNIYSKRRWNMFRFGPSVADIMLKVEGVAINVRLDATITQITENQHLNSGGIVLFHAKTPESRKNIELRRRQVSSLILWSLGDQGNIEPLPRLCISFDVFGGELVKATDSQSTFRTNVRSSCREAATMWPRVTPPADYDGPEWT
ncbi:MAG: hypothetical protein RLZ59_1586 [Pseudomonadota bacterium]